MTPNDYRLQTLLKEYETCAGDVFHLDTRFWQLTAIFALLVAGLAGFLAQSDQLRDGARDIEITALGIFMAGISLVWFSLYWGHFRAQQLTYFRMREIEAGLGMRKGLYVHAVDHWKDLKAQKEPESPEAQWFKELSQTDKCRLHKFYSHLPTELFGPLHWFTKLGLGRVLRPRWMVMAPAVLGLVAGFGVVWLDVQ